MVCYKLFKYLMILRNLSIRYQGVYSREIKLRPFGGQIVWGDTDKKSDYLFT